MKLKRKTPSQLQSLQQLYSENKYPTKELMEDHAATLGLTYKQLRGWFIEKRRRDKRDNGTILTPQTKIAKRKIKPILLLQNFFTPDYILKKVFRKDGPPLGVQFDSLPSPSIFSPKGSCYDALVIFPTLAIDFATPQALSGSVTAWRATNPDGGGLLVSILLTGKCCSNILLLVICQVEPNEDEHLKQPDKIKCELASEGPISREYLNQVAMLVDDEELELQELQAGPNPLRCSDHFAANSIHGCSLCKVGLRNFM
uniref:Homeobox domain-containing protein n=1 Tax=Fagus sylvatica TaxID=28930 RepID=A0A2N9H323_FAGSY